MIKAVRKFYFPPIFSVSTCANGFKLVVRSWEFVVGGVSLRSEQEIYKNPRSKGGGKKSKKDEKLNKKRKNDSFYCVNLQKITHCFSIRARVLK